jgi:hypothetical protein
MLLFLSNIFCCFYFLFILLILSNITGLKCIKLKVCHVYIQ